MHVQAAENSLEFEPDFRTAPLIKHASSHPVKDLLTRLPPPFPFPPTLKYLLADEELKVLMGIVWL